MLQIIEITGADGALVEPDRLARAEAVHRQLRPDLESDYPAQMRRLFADGARMVVAADGGEVRGLAVWRLQFKTYAPRELYVDDLVTDQGHRSGGVGGALLAWLEGRARELGCGNLSLDSGTQRQQAHRFYFRAGMLITSFHFFKKLG